MFTNTMQTFYREAYKPTVKNIVRRVRAFLNYLGRFCQFVIVMTVLTIGQVFLMRPIWSAHQLMEDAHNKIFALTDAESLLASRSILGSILSIVLLYVASVWLWAELDLDVKKKPSIAIKEGAEA